VITATDFRDNVLSIIGRYENLYKRSLDEYLRALLSSITQHSSEVPSYALFVVIFEEAFHRDPIQFDDDWMRLITPPTNLVAESLRRLKANSYGFLWPTTDTTTTGLPDLDCLFQTIKFQIAELRRFSEKKPEEYGRYAEYASKYKYMGLESPTGEGGTSYNWDPFTYLECATAGLVANSRWQIPECETGSSWSVLAYVLEWGRTYELL